MYLVIRKLVQSYGLFKTEDEARQYGMAEWSDTNFTIISLKEALEELGLDFKEV